MDIVTLQLARKYVDKAVAGVGSLRGKSAYEIALDNGFSGSEKAWLESLKGEPGVSPTIGDNGHWFFGDIDSGVKATQDKKLTADGDEIVFDSDRLVVEVVKGGTRTVVANYSDTDGIEQGKIDELFLED